MDVRAWRAISVLSSPHQTPAYSSEVQQPQQPIMPYSHPGDRTAACMTAVD